MLKIDFESKYIYTLLALGQIVDYLIKVNNIPYDTFKWAAGNHGGVDLAKAKELLDIAMYHDGWL